MKKLLKDEYEDFLKCYNNPPFKGIRINTLKADEKVIFEQFGILEKTPFSPLSYYLGENSQINGKHPLHHAGAFYIQEPSATSAVTALSPNKGDKVLDLCASPGGKSTQIASLLQGTGLLWSNEIVKNRAWNLSSNIERMGVRNAVVSSCHPDVLCKRLSGYFDKVLVDAPCSGEGMFRKEKGDIKAWSKEQVMVCANRQLQILNSAKNALKEGGILLYSTCTFSMEENEKVIEKFILENPEFQVVDCNLDFGRPGFSPLNKSRRIFPMDKGEGHFVAKLKKNGGENNDYFYVDKPLPKDVLKKTEEMYQSIFVNKPFGERLSLFGDKVCALPEILPEMSGLSVIKAGVTLGEVKKNRVEPHHNAFTCANKKEVKRV
ncbi:MAG: RsmF rRNA methyltransferase first C-terminal domain-containing protein, partial [Acutalibacteraceae bacterium]